MLMMLSCWAADAHDAGALAEPGPAASDDASAWG